MGTRSWFAFLGPLLTTLDHGAASALPWSRNGPMNRWYGGMVHELGHAFGLPDPSSTDGTPMSASFYDYPNTHFSQSQKNQILAGPYGSFLS